MGLGVLRQCWGSRSYNGVGSRPNKGGLWAGGRQHNPVGPQVECGQLLHPRNVYAALWAGPRVDQLQHVPCAWTALAGSQLIQPYCFGIVGGYAFSPMVFSGL